MIVKHLTRPLFEPTLQPRHFSALGLSARQLHLWLGRAGYENAEHKTGKWRVFSPVEVFRLAALKSLKDETDLAISRHPALINFLDQDEKFAAETVGIWASGLNAVLVTDLQTQHQVTGLHAAELRLRLNPASKILLTMDLEPELLLMFDAVKSGGTSEQKSVIDQIIGFRKGRVGDFDAAAVPDDGREKAETGNTATTLKTRRKLGI